MAKSFRNNSIEKLEDLILELEDFLKDDLIQFKANNLSINAWHIIDWILIEYREVHGFVKIEDLRSSLYTKCDSLKMFHDIANSSKHNNLSRPKANIKKTNNHLGHYSTKHYSREHYNVSRLEIELEDGTILDFNNEIKKVINFWKNYFQDELGISLN
jgi:hypothetical protein